MDTPASVNDAASPASATEVDLSILDDHAILLFDGVCNLCNGFVNFVIDQDERGVIKLAALQSEEAAPWLRRAGLDPGHLDSVVLIEKGRVTRKSTAALRAAWRLGLPWSPLIVLMAVPRPLRDVVYDLVARYRYDWFGERESCRMPTPELRARFL